MIWRAALLLILPTLAIRAADPVPPADDAIAKAKRDYETIKAAKAGTDQPGIVSLPKQDSATFDLHLTADLPLPSTSPNAKKDDRDPTGTGKQKSANWLVDALAAPKDRASAKTSRDLLGQRTSTTDELSPDADPLTRDRALTREKADTTAKTDRAADRTDKHSTSAAANPLNRYMAAWMTPQDFALLNAKSATNPDTPGATSPASPVPGSGAGESALSDLAIPGTDSSTPFGTLPGVVSTPSTTKENPYLADLALPVPPANPAPLNLPAPSPLLSPTAPTPAAITAPPSGPAAKASPLLDQIQKSQEDAKAFKQLKRF